MDRQAALQEILDNLTKLSSIFKLVDYQSVQDFCYSNPDITGNALHCTLKSLELIKEKELNEKPNNY